MLEVIIAFIGLSLGFVIGAITVGIGLYPQLVLLRGMLIDKHAVENRKAGIKTSAVKEIAPEAPTAPMNKELLAQLVPPDIFTRRKQAEAEEADKAARRAATVQLINDM